MPSSNSNGGISGDENLELEGVCLVHGDMTFLANMMIGASSTGVPLFIGCLVAALLSCSLQTSSDATESASTIEFSAFMDEPWRTLNDGVMGGVSEGSIEWTDSSMVWTGQTRLENNGGFASVREPWGHRNLHNLEQINIRCRGKGGPLKLTLETSQRWWMPYAYASFQPTDEWQNLVLDAKEFSWSQAQLGDLTSVSPRRDLSDVLRLGFMKYDGTAQAFELEVASMSFVMSEDKKRR